MVHFLKFDKPIGKEINEEILEGFCPECFGASIFEIIDANNEKAQMVFKGKRYLCFDCKHTFDKLKESFTNG